jgi:uncharacterized membrane protein
MIYTEIKGRSHNIGSTERVASAIAGGTLIVTGLFRRGWLSVPLIAAGVQLIRRGTSGHCELYDKLGVDTNAGSGSRLEALSKPVWVEDSVTIQRPIKEVYTYWRDLENLPRIMSHLESVTVQDATRSHWVAKAPLGQQVAWDAEITDDQPNVLLSWRSLSGADIQNAGTVHFVEAPGGATTVRVSLEYTPPAGKLGTAVARLLGEEPHQQIAEDLRRLRQTLELGKPD